MLFSMIARGEESVTPAGYVIPKEVFLDYQAVKMTAPTRMVCDAGKTEFVLFRRHGITFVGGKHQNGHSVFEFTAGQYSFFVHEFENKVVLITASEEVLLNTTPMLREEMSHFLRFVHGARDHDCAEVASL